jgi:hypothetical protein
MYWSTRLLLTRHVLTGKESIIDSNPFSPPTTDVRDVAPVRSPHRPWHTWLVAGITGVAALIGIIGSSTLGIKLGLSLGLIYMLCLPSFGWIVLAYVIYVRSRYALATAIGVFIAQRLIAPVTLYFSKKGLGYHVEFDYLQALTTQFGRILWFDWIAMGAILLYCAWDYRERFATWLREEPDASSLSE